MLKTHSLAYNLRSTTQQTDPDTTDSSEGEQQLDNFSQPTLANSPEPDLENFSQSTSVCCISQNTLENVHSGSKEVQLKPSQIKAIKGVCGELHKVLGEIEMTVSVSKLKLP